MTGSGFTPSPAAELRDPALPGIGAAFDTERIAAIVGGREGAAPRCRVSYVRYKPGTSCVVAYAFQSDDEGFPPAGHVKVYAADDFRIARAKLTGRRWWSVEPRPPFVVLEDERAILFLFPNDPELGGLRLFAHPKALQRALHANSDAYPSDRWRISDRRIRISLVRYKPEKRAVIRVDTRAVERETGERRDFTAFGRVYAGDSAKHHFAFMRSLAGEAAARAVRVPRAIGCLQDDGIVLVDRLEGTPVACDELAAGGAGTLLSSVGAALCELHACAPGPVVTRGRDDAIEGCAATARTISAVAPAAAEAAARAVAGLQAMSQRIPAGSRGFVHGDFHPGQLLVNDEGVGVLDFDRSHEAEPAADLGNFRAHLLASDVGTMASREATAAVLVAGYRNAGGAAVERGALDFWTAVGLMNLAVQPFRALEQGWRERIADRVARCEAVMYG